MAELINLTPKWEYMSESEVSMERMNELGAEGWELTFYNAYFDQKDYAMKNIAIFKRVRYEQLETQEQMDGITKQTLEKTNTKAAIKREKRDTCISDSEREQAQRMK